VVDEPISRDIEIVVYEDMSNANGNIAVNRSMRNTSHRRPVSPSQRNQQNSSCMKILEEFKLNISELFFGRMYQEFNVDGSCEVGLWIHDEIWSHFDDRDDQLHALVKVHNGNIFLRNLTGDWVNVLEVVHEIQEAVRDENGLRENAYVLHIPDFFETGSERVEFGPILTVQEILIYKRICRIQKNFILMTHMDVEAWVAVVRISSGKHRSCILRVSSGKIECMQNDGNWMCTTNLQIVVAVSRDRVVCNPRGQWWISTPTGQQLHAISPVTSFWIQPDESVQEVLVDMGENIKSELRVLLHDFFDGVMEVSSSDPNWICYRIEESFCEFEDAIEIVEKIEKKLFKIFFQINKYCIDISISQSPFIGYFRVVFEFSYI